MTAQITDADTLQRCIGALPGPRDMKVIDHLDAWAVRWLKASPLAFFGFGDAEGIAITVGGGPAGFARTDTPSTLDLPPTRLDDPRLARAGQSFCSLWLVPGLGETLRINGQVAGVEDGRIGIAVRECYLHCAKALIRSDFWQAAPDPLAAPLTPVQAAARSRFLVLATVNGAGQADLSPKGDPAGALLQADEAALWLPDRPGNRRVDSFRNLLEQPRLSLAALVPGQTRLLHVRGTATLTTDAAARARLAVGDKPPKLVTRIAPAHWTVRDSAALAAAALWPAAQPPDDLAPAEIFKAHVRLNRSSGLQAAMVRAAVAVPGLVRHGLDQDYKKNLY
ncbi:pyridoxamine 5'-phosphate oxidase family protein [Pseudoxanthomonas sp. UC19_8]|uniref:pyridoxamine 5'-phosphate oxidase family protein n=1 Tax=Pseudoxanthomonas sp. UC19_8 TaxID=3350175 RepID=UPI0036D3FBA8